MTSDPRSPLVEQLRALAEKWRNDRAHTYASENADLYRGFDNGCQRCAADLDALIGSLPQTPETNADDYKNWMGISENIIVTPQEQRTPFRSATGKHRYEDAGMEIVKFIKAHIAPAMDENDGGEILWQFTQLCERVYADALSQTPETWQLDEDDCIDDVTVHDVATFRLERMDSGHWWLALSRRDGSRATIDLMSDDRISATKDEEPAAPQVPGPEKP